MFERVRCVVLNASYEPLAIVPAKRGIVLCFEGKASIVEEHPEITIRSPLRTWPVPTQVVLTKYVKARTTFRVPASLSKHHLYIRDKFTCQYCNRHRSEFRKTEFLTKDHIHPKERGGKSTWENLVTACSTCNNKKANRPLAETGMVLSKKPYTPTVFEIWSKSSSKHFKS